jgi:hypothetical protein
MTGLDPSPMNGHGNGWNGGIKTSKVHEILHQTTPTAFRKDRDRDTCFQVEEVGTKNQNASIIIAISAFLSSS